MLLWIPSPSSISSTMMDILRAQLSQNVKSEIPDTLSSPIQMLMEVASVKRSWQSSKTGSFKGWAWKVWRTTERGTGILGQNSCQITSKISWLLMTSKGRRCWKSLNSRFCSQILTPQECQAKCKSQSWTLQELVRNEGIKRRRYYCYSQTGGQKKNSQVSPPKPLGCWELRSL